eukprot:9086909-Pyramimonas_sp.AAC.1
MKRPAPQTVDPRCRGGAIRQTGFHQNGTCEAGNRAADGNDETLPFSTPLMTGLVPRADTRTSGVTTGPWTARPRSLAATPGVTRTCAREMTGYSIMANGHPSPRTH